MKLDWMSRIGFTNFSKEINSKTPQLKMVKKTLEIILTERDDSKQSSIESFISD